MKTLEKLDKIDKQILKLMQENGRITNIDLANQVGISAPPCLRRVKALEDAGLITSYHAEVDAKQLGYGVNIFAFVEMNNHTEEALATFEKTMKEWDVVLEYYMLAGDADYILRIVAKDWENYQNFLTKELLVQPNVGHVKSVLSIRGYKNHSGIPL